MSVVRKNGKFCVCIDFRNLNNVIPKDEYPLLVVDIFIDSSIGNNIMYFMDKHSGYNNYVINEEDVSKTIFR